MKNTAPQYVMSEVKKIFQYSYPGHLFSRVMSNFKTVVNLFDGKFKGYLACNTEYHNLGHTLDALLASARLIDGHNLSAGKMDPDLAVDLLLAALFHDSGYIQEEWDKTGTGAKYTKTHVERSIDFIRKNVSRLQMSENEEITISNIIACTGMQLHLDDIVFSSKEEQIAGAILGTADLLGQMSDRCYLEKLLFLYSEFREAGIPGYETEYDIIRKTADFYAGTTNRLNKDLLGVSVYAKAYFYGRYGVDRNLYIEAIERHMNYIQKIINDSTTNFRTKLKRNKSSYIAPSAAAIS
jgi:hypothetical protein